MRLIATFIFALIVSISATSEYGWFMGIVHGYLAPYNWVISWFSDSWLVKAPIHTTAYNVFWWIALISSCGDFIRSIFQLLMQWIALIVKKYEKE